MDNSIITSDRANMALVCFCAADLVCRATVDTDRYPTIAAERELYRKLLAHYYSDYEREIVREIRTMDNPALSQYIENLKKGLPK